MVSSNTHWNVCVCISEKEGGGGSSKDQKDYIGRKYGSRKVSFQGPLKSEINGRKEECPSKPSTDSILQKIVYSIYTKVIFVHVL